MINEISILKFEIPINFDRHCSCSEKYYSKSAASVAEHLEGIKRISFNVVLMTKILYGD